MYQMERPAKATLRSRFIHFPMGTEVGVHTVYRELGGTWLPAHYFYGVVVGGPTGIPAGEYGFNILLDIVEPQPVNGPAWPPDRRQQDYPASLVYFGWGIEKVEAASGAIYEAKAVIKPTDRPWVTADMGDMAIRGFDY